MTGYSGCGIAGFLVHQCAPGPVPDRDDVAAMSAALSHRGPDAEGLWARDRVMFGHRRLSIVGLGETGAQPMTRDQLTITYNGELYNFRELREELATEFVFTSGTDTEVVLRAWQKWGPAALHRFCGMFAFVVYDHRTREMTLVRDRLGIKPLYFHAGPAAFVFASEVQGLLACSTVPRSPDLDTISHRLLCSSTLEVDPWRTAISDVRSLPAAMYLVVAADGTTTATTYWSLPHTDPYARRSPTEFADLLTESVETMRVADVTVSAFLSGGLDSAAITALAARQDRVTAVTVAYGTSQMSGENHVNDDERFSRLLVEHLPGRIDHHIHVRPHQMTLDDIDAVCDFAAVCDDVRHIGILANYQAVRDLGLRVVLNGQGADETMGGYVGQPSFIANILDVADRDPNTIRRLPGSRQTPGLSPDVLSHQRFAHSDVLDFLHDQPGTILERIHRFLVATQIPRIVQFEDFLAMRASVEARFPFLDHRLVERCFAGPFEHHVHSEDRSGKTMLRAALRDILPGSVIARQKAVFPHPPDAVMRRELAMLARQHHESLRGDPLVTALFTLSATEDFSTWPVNRLWTVLSMWRWHQRLASLPRRVLAAI